MKKQSIAVIGPNQSNPWMDPIHVQLSLASLHGHAIAAESAPNVVGDNRPVYSLTV